MPREASSFTDVNQSVEQRVGSQMRELALLIADKALSHRRMHDPLMADDVTVDGIRVRIAAEAGR